MGFKKKKTINSLYKDNTPFQIVHCYTYYIARAATERWYPQAMPDPPYEWSRGINSKLLNTASLVHFLSYFLHAAFAFQNWFASC